MGVLARIFFFGAGVFEEKKLHAFVLQKMEDNNATTQLRVYSFFLLVLLFSKN